MINRVTATTLSHSGMSTSNASAMAPACANISIAARNRDGLRLILSTGILYYVGAMAGLESRPDFICWRRLPLGRIAAGFGDARQRVDSVDHDSLRLLVLVPRYRLNVLDADLIHLGREVAVDDSAEYRR